MKTKQTFTELNRAEQLSIVTVRRGRAGRAPHRRHTRPNDDGDAFEAKLRTVFVITGFRIRAGAILTQISHIHLNLPRYIGLISKTRILRARGLTTMKYKIERTANVWNHLMAAGRQVNVTVLKFLD